ncbi:MAG: RNA polymerase sigma factor [Acidobacteriaceae bacterium]
MELATKTGWNGSSHLLEDASWTEEATFQSLVQRQTRFVFRVAYALLRNAYDADDVVQETFLRIYRKRLWLNMKDERAFLARVAWRIARDRQRRPRMEVNGAELNDIPARSANPEDALISGDTTSAVHRLIDSLPDELRQPLVLSTLEEMTSAQIAAVLGIPEGTVRTRILRARQILKPKLAIILGQHHAK